MRFLSEVEIGKKLISKSGKAKQVILEDLGEKRRQTTKSIFAVGGIWRKYFL